ASRAAGRPPLQSSPGGCPPSAIVRSACSSSSPSVDVVVGRQGQELREVICERHALEQLSRIREATALEGLRVSDLAHPLRRHPPVLHPLPDLRARDL